MIISGASTSPSVLLKPLGARLPSSPGRLFGRDGALTELEDRLHASRVLSLCGPGGAGKTRLALALAQRVTGRFTGGVHWVDLAGTVNPSLVGHAVATVVGREQPAVDPTAAVIAQHLDGPTLLVLDNCEQVADGCAALLEGVLDRCPELQVLVTSRRSVGIRGENVCRTAGLAISSANGEGGGEAAPTGDGDAVTLFVERAREAMPAFDLSDPPVREAVVEICRALDGMPLAIELAAARVPLLGAVAMAERLTGDIRILRQPRVSGAPERQRTLEATLEWSHNLLGSDERTLFARLAVFPSAFTLVAAERVCADEALEAPDLFDALEGLVDCSLVHLIDSPRQPRFRLLGIVRQYASTKLQDSGEADVVRARHAAYYADLAGGALPPGTRAGTPDALRLLEPDRDNLSAALRCLAGASPEAGARLAMQLWPLWHLSGGYREAREWFSAILDGDAQLSDATRAGTLLTAGEVAFLQCDYAVARQWLTTALPIARHLGDRGVEAAILQRLGSIARERGQYDDARQLHVDSRRICRERDDAHGIARAQNGLGFSAWLSRSGDLGEATCAEALTVFEAASAMQETVEALTLLGAIALYAGRLDDARARLMRARDISREIGFGEGIAWTAHELAILGRRRRRPIHELAALLDEALVVHHRLGDRWRLASVLEEVAGSVLSSTAPHTAAELLGAAASLRLRLGTPIPPVEENDRDAAAARLQHKLGRETYVSHFGDGRGLDVDTAVDRARDALARVRTPDPGNPAALTEREATVLRLVAGGLTNREIGERLFISQSTAGVHVSNILQKLGCRRRADAAARAAQLGLLDPDPTREGTTS